jgi:hypothetical protein
MTRRPCLTALIPSALLLALSALGEAHRALWEHGQLASRYQVSREAFARWMRRSVTRSSHSSRECRTSCGDGAAFAAKFSNAR